MLAKLVCGTLGALALATAAHASDATTVADRAGFLIGHAQRCGVAEARLERSTKRIRAVIAAFAADDQDRDAAQAQFAESITASALAQLLGDKLPSCATIRSTFAEFEQHRQTADKQTADKREGSLARNDGHDTPQSAASANPAPDRAARRTSARREHPAANRRAQAKWQRLAQQTHGKPPSI